MSEYSIAIRTIGKAGEKYRKLLRSIDECTHRPEKVIIVLPEGYAPPEDRLGYEEFVYCPKSMIGQRLEALKHIDSEYTLFLDDDISFDPDFADKLLEPLEEGEFDCSTGPLFSFFPVSTAGKIAGTLTGSVSVSVFHRDMYVKILRTGGWAYHTFNTNEKRYYPTESFAWTCFMIRTQCFRDINMEDEIPWLEKFGYAMGDDRVMAYKLIKRDCKACIVSNAPYAHNDAKTSTSSQEMVKTKPSFCMGFFHVLFWKRFILDLESNWLHRTADWICFTYWLVAMFGYYCLKCIKKQNRATSRAFFKGVREGLAFMHTEEFMMLPAVKPQQTK